MTEDNAAPAVCRNCVLPEFKPDIVLDETGLCSVCAAFKAGPSGEGGPIHETELIKILNKHRGRAKYDCLVMCSGGKDSTMALYNAVRRYKLRPLAFTFDHQFEDGAAVDNARGAARALGVDWLYLRSGEAKDIFRKLLDCGSKAPVCHVCAIWYVRETLRLAKGMGISLVLGGWTRGQASLRGEGCPEFASMSGETAAFVREHLRADPRWKDFPASVGEAAASAGKGITVLSPHWFLRHDPAEAAAFIEKELAWKPTPVSYPRGSTNCLLNFLSVDRSLAHYGFTHYHVELSRLIRLGELTRAEALEMLKPDFDRSVLARVAKELGIKE